MNNYLLPAAACAIMSGIGMCLAAFTPLGTPFSIVVGQGTMYDGGSLSLKTLHQPYSD